MFNKIFRVQTHVKGFAALTICAATITAFAQDKQPLEWVVGMAAGGGTDIVARSVGDQMAKALEQTIVVINKPGAAHNIAAEYVVRSNTPSKHLFTAAEAVMAGNPFIYSKLGYDAEKDFSSVGMLVRFPLILVVSPKLPVKTFPELVSWIKAQQGSVPYASPGSGTPHHLAAEYLRKQASLSLTHLPYKGAAPAIQDLASGVVPFMFVESAGGLPLINGGKVRPIAVASNVRMKQLPDVPTIKEQGLPHFEFYAWQGLSVRASTPKAEITRLNSALRNALNSEPVKARLDAMGIEPMPGSPEQMDAFVSAERAKWGELIREIGLKVD